MPHPTSPALNVCLSSLYLLMLLLSQGAMAANGSRGASLNVSPRLCISSQQEPECKLTLELTWQVEGSEPICILSDYPAMPKYCPESRGTEQLSLNVTTNKDIQFMLVNRVTNLPLSGTKFKVTPTSQPKARRRYRNPWSLF